MILGDSSDIALQRLDQSWDQFTQQEVWTSEAQALQTIRSLVQSYDKAIEGE
jgi:hypothetical protein